MTSPSEPWPTDRAAGKANPEWLTTVPHPAVRVWNDEVLNRKYVGAYATAGTYSQMEPITQFTNSGAFNPNGNNEGFKSDRYSQVVSSAAAEPNAANRRQLYTQLNDLLLDEA